MFDNDNKQDDDEMIPFFSIASRDFDKDSEQYSSIVNETS
jgi:hypothetical protein